jgi:hypothetical protein
MPSLMSKLSSFARSPKGREMTRKAQDFASRPETKQKIMGLRSRLARKR